MMSLLTSPGGAIWALLLTVSGTAAPPDPANVPKVRSRTFDVNYAINDAARPLSLLELWYTRDSGQTWHNAGSDRDTESPIAFTATEEGLYGFFVVAANSAGASSPTPQSGTTPQQWAFVDYTPPVVQLHPVRPGSSGPARTLLVKWTAIDAHLASRPVALTYRTLDDGAWETIARALANTGRFEWRIPDDVTGRIMLRISVRDAAGNLSTAALGATDLEGLFRPAPAAPEPTPAAVPADQARHEPTELDRARAQRLFEQATAHAARRQHQLAISRLKDTLTLDPTRSDALVELGRALYAVGDTNESVRAYELALAQDSDLRAARAGLALTFYGVGEYDRAVEHLQAILQQNPKDVEAWLYLGDVEFRRGDELTALEHYEKAATLDPEAREVIQQARARLDNLDALRKKMGPFVTSAKPDEP